MCGIVGYVGHRKAEPLLMNCLSRLEYRGYDSCGIAVQGSAIEVHKDLGRVHELKQTLPKFKGKLGIGHTRWATHGEPSKINAHPHMDCTGNIAVVHNGVINNYHRLKQQLISEGHSFVSETDTEVIAHLIEKHYQGNLEKAVSCALDNLEGSYAILVIMSDNPEVIAAKKDSPLIIGVGDSENFVASDVPAILDYTDRVIYLDEGDIAVLTKDSIKVTNNKMDVNRQEHRITWSVEDIQKAGYEHFMLKEIYEQPKVIRNSLGEHIASTEPLVDWELLLTPEHESLCILASGTSYHAGLIGKYLIQKLLGIPVRVELASEFTSYNGESIPRVIAITQSGETADVLKAMKKLKQAECKLLVITNVLGSTASRLADHIIYTKAGPEVSVAATKTFIAQLVALYQLVLSHPALNGRICEHLFAELRQLPAKLQRMLNEDYQIVDCARYLSGYDHIFILGKGINLPVALEGALKLKEISYIHAEGSAAGELKHGAFALLDHDTPVITIAANDDTHMSMLTTIKEVKARGAPVIALADEGDEVIGALADFVITLPRIHYLFSPVVNTVALQLLAYHTARLRRYSIDFPRNLAKSVTVE